MTKFLDTTDNLNIIDSDDYITQPLHFDLGWLDLSLSKCFQAMSDMFVPIESEKPVMYLIDFNGNEEELDWVIENLVEVGIEKIVPTTTSKFEEKRPQPRFEIAENLAANMLSQKRLINYKSITKAFTIRVLLNGEIAYDLIKEN